VIRSLLPAAKWISAHALLFVAIVLLLALTHFNIRPLVEDYHALKNQIARLRYLAQTFPVEANGAIGEIRSHWPRSPERSPDSLRGRIALLKQHKEALLKQGELLRRENSHSHQIPGTDAWVELALIDLKLESIETLLGALADLEKLTTNAELMEEEINTLAQSKEQRDRLISENRNQSTGIKLRIAAELRPLQNLIAECKEQAAEILANSRQMDAISRANPVLVLTPYTGPHEAYQNLERINDTLQQIYSDGDCRRRIKLDQDLRKSLREIESNIQELEKGNQALSESLSEAEQLLGDARKAIAAELDLSAAEALRDENAAAINHRIERGEQIFNSNLYYRLVSAFESYYKPALLILAAVTMAPYLCALLAYYVFAGVVSNRFSLRLEKRKGHKENSVSDSMESSRIGITSGRSIPIEITPQDVLIVRPEFRESGPSEDKASTVWVYDWRRPVMSIASNLTAMTRFESKASDEVRLGSTSDAHTKLAAIRLADGESLVVRPRSVIGIVQDPSNPVRVRSIWKPLSPGCWLRFQVRFVVFSGPGQIIVQGRNGVIAERADSGRTVSQAATVAYSTHLSYSVSRCETFAGYVTGAQALFNDRFAGPGIFVYEAAPRSASMRHGLTRFIQDVADSLMRALGI
jgi:uncharacterized protein (AIM24 family)